MAVCWGDSWEELVLVMLLIVVVMVQVVALYGVAGLSDSWGRGLQAACGCRGLQQQSAGLNPSDALGLSCG